MKKLPFFVAAIFSFVVITGFIATKNKLESLNNSQKPTYSATLTLWHLDLLEGGKGSRSSFLKSAIKTFNQQNRNVNVVVEVHSKYSCEQNFKKGIFPDMISYSYGLDGVEALFNEIELSGYDGVYIGKKLYAINFALGGYVLISKSDKVEKRGEKLYVSQAETNMPMIAYYLEGLEFEKVVDNRPIDAYTNFLADKNSSLLGTQRDVFRLKKRGVDFSCQPLASFSDLRYFISITKKENYDVCLDFIKLLTGDFQKNVESIGLVSPSVNSNDEVISSFSFARSARCVYGYPDYKTIKSVNDVLYDEGKTNEEKLNTVKNILK